MDVMPNMFLKRMYQCDNVRVVEIQGMLEYRIKAVDYNVEVKRVRQEGAS